MRERSGRQDVTERKRPAGLARLASAANATTESGAKRRRGLGQAALMDGREQQSLRSLERASHSAVRLLVDPESREGNGSIQMSGLAWVMG